MTRALALVALLAAPAPVLGAQAAAAPAPKAVPAASAGPAVVNLSLIEAVAAIEMPQITGLFAFIAEQDASFAFADLIARDPKAMKKYLKKLESDKKVANGLTAWDHEVCASLVNLYASSLGATMGRPNEKTMGVINECVLATVVPLSEIVSRRKR
ncbi:MAG: hypothetical protein SF051_11400 [Elusimicrobiota bacterium]|nr:hypothetical protein [Elusimicrobiota bacterium]